MLNTLRTFLLKLHVLFGFPIPEAALPRFFLYGAIFSPHLVEGREDFAGWRAVCEAEKLSGGRIRKFVADKLIGHATTVEEFIYAGQYAEGDRFSEKGGYDLLRATRAFTKARQLATAPEASFEELRMLIKFLDHTGYYDARETVLKRLIEEMLARPLTPEQSALLWGPCISNGSHRDEEIEQRLEGVTAERASWQRALDLAPRYAKKLRETCQRKLAAA